MADLYEAFKPPGPKPRPKPGPRPGPKPRPKPRPKPGPRPGPKPGPKPRPRPKPGPRPRPGPKPRPRPRPGPGPWRWPWRRRNVLVDRSVTNVYPTYTYDDGIDYVDERPIYENPQLWIIIALIIIIIGIWVGMRRKK